MECVLKLEDGRKDVKKEQVLNSGSSFLNPNIEYFSLYAVQQETLISAGDSALDHNAYPDYCKILATFVYA